MKITDVVLVEVSGELHPVAPPSEDRRVDPLDIYPEFNAPFQARTPDPAYADVVEHLKSELFAM